MPRQVVPGATVMIVRRCRQRQFLLRPDDFVNQLFGFCVAWAAEYFQVQVHALAIMSGHVHIVATDTKGRLPEFMRWLFSTTARCLNAHYGERDNVWSVEGAKVTVLGSRARAEEMLAYVITNPSDCGAVETYSDWPGLVTAPRDIGGEGTQYPRPPGFFRDNGPVPKGSVATLRFDPPPWIASDNAAAVRAFANAVETRVLALEATARAQRETRGQGVEGRVAVKAESRDRRGKTFQPIGDITPHFAACCAELRKAMATALKTFRDMYAKARRAWQAGQRNVLFPYGTYGFDGVPGVRVQRKRPPWHPVFA